MALFSIDSMYKNKQQLLPLKKNKASNASCHQTISNTCQVLCSSNNAPVLWNPGMLVMGAFGTLTKAQWHVRAWHFTVICFLPTSIQ